MQKTWVWSLGWEDPLEKGKATHSSILSRRTPWIVQSMGSQRVGHDWVTYTFTFQFLWNISQKYFQYFQILETGFNYFLKAVFSCYYIFLVKVILKVKVAQSCPTLCDPVDYTVHGILQARILEWVDFPFSRGSSQPKDQTQISRIAGGFFTSWATREAQENWSG